MSVTKIVSTIFFISVSIGLLSFSNSNTAILHIDSSSKEIVEPAMQGSINKVFDFYQKEYGLVLQSPLDVIVSKDYEFIAEKWHDLTDGKYSKAIMSVMQFIDCQRTENIAGQAGMNLIKICFNTEDKVTSSWLSTNKNKLDYVIAHEMMHVFQYQLSHADNTIIEGRSKHGPQWMVEGHATYVQLEFYSNLNWGEDRLPILMATANESKKTLHDTFKKRRLKLPEYHLSQYAVFLLVQKYGRQKLIEYWKSLSEYPTWEIAFQKTFGIELAEYMDEFETLRYDKDKALSWIKA